MWLSRGLRIFIIRVESNAYRVTVCLILRMSDLCGRKKIYAERTGPKYLAEISQGARDRSGDDSGDYCGNWLNSRSPAPEYGVATPNIYAGRLASGPTLGDTTCRYQREVEVKNMPERHHPMEGGERVLFL